jgi:lysozyme|tara:strand:+ start:389 stop:865 length:477 start_codon:yes stop_codon:yes gene_type:complete
MQISQEGVTLIKHYEGCPKDQNGNAVSYRCPANKPTIGYGSLKLIDGSPVKDDMSITMQEAEDLLAHELKEYEGYINDLVEVPLKQNEFDALVSWVFNLGPTNLKSSTLLKVLNAGDYENVPEQIKRWNKVNGVVNEGLVKRRKSESLLFKSKDWTEV